MNRHVKKAALLIAGVYLFYFITIADRFKDDTSKCGLPTTAHDYDHMTIISPKRRKGGRK